VLVSRGELAWSRVIALLAWFGIGTVMALLGYEAFRTRRSKLFGGEPARGALMMLCGAIGIYAGITGIPRFFRNPMAPSTTPTCDADGK